MTRHVRWSVGKATAGRPRVTTLQHIEIQYEGDDAMTDDEIREAFAVAGRPLTSLDTSVTAQWNNPARPT
jgi:hypothetical protein